MKKKKKKKKKKVYPHLFSNILHTKVSFHTLLSCSHQSVHPHQSAPSSHLHPLLRLLLLLLIVLPSED